MSDQENAFNHQAAEVFRAGHEGWSRTHSRGAGEGEELEAGVGGEEIGTVAAAG